MDTKKRTTKHQVGYSKHVHTYAIDLSIELFLFQFGAVSSNITEIYPKLAVFFLYLQTNMKYLAVKIRKFLRFAFISAVLCSPNVNFFISEIDILKPLA